MVYNIMDDARKCRLQVLCRDYLSRLRPMARKYGLEEWLCAVIDSNRRGKCIATEKEVTMLSRFCDDERVGRVDIPRLVGLSYRQCVERGLFNRIRRLRRLGIYSKISVLLLNNKK